MKTLVTLGIVAILFHPVLSEPTHASDKEEAEREIIDIVFCLDCSGSMGYIIESAKKKIWSIVNDIARDKPVPRLRIGLIGYGDSNRTHRFFPLSDDLDKIYEDLTTFRDEGWGSEWVGLAIRKATREMEWSGDSRAVKIIFVLGNETARQGKPDYSTTAPEAIRQGITINAIYCGEPNETEASTWQEFTRLADGRYTTIQLHTGTLTIKTPYDEKLAELTRTANSTYVPYGQTGKAKKARQATQDDNARLSGGSATLAERAVSKNSSLYDNSGWDLVDASASKDFDWEKLDRNNLPEALRNMSLDELKAHVETNRTKRASIRREVAELGRKREAFVEKEMDKQDPDRKKGLDEEVREMLDSARSK